MSLREKFIKKITDKINLVGVIVYSLLLYLGIDVYPKYQLNKGIESWSLLKWKFSLGAGLLLFVLPSTIVFLMVLFRHELFKLEAEKPILGRLILIACILFIIVSFVGWAVLQWYLYWWGSLY